MFESVCREFAKYRNMPLEDSNGELSASKGRLKTEILKLGIIELFYVTKKEEFYVSISVDNDDEETAQIGINGRCFKDYLMQLENYKGPSDFPSEVREMFEPYLNHIEETGVIPIGMLCEDLDDYERDDLMALLDALSPKTN